MNVISGGDSGVLDLASASSTLTLERFLFKMSLIIKLLNCASHACYIACKYKQTVVFFFK